MHICLIAAGTEFKKFNNLSQTSVASIFLGYVEKLSDWYSKESVGDRV